METMYGIWTPRTAVHFLEVVKLVEGARPNPYVKDPEKLLEKIKPVRFQVKDGKILELELDYEDGVISVFSNGVVISKANNPNVALKRLNNILEVFSEIFKAGMPVPALVSRDITPIEIIISEKECDDVKNELYKSKNVIISENKIWVNENYMKENQIYLVHCLIILVCIIKFARNVINIHRRVWEAVDNIRKPTNISMQLILQLKEELVKYKHQLEYVEVRLSQVGEALVGTKNLLKDVFDEEVVETLYEECEYLIRYTKHLWKKTIEYTKETIENIEVLRWAMHQQELETVRNIAIIYVIVEVGGFIVHHPMTPKEFALFIVGALIAAYIIHKIVRVLSKFIWRFKKEKFNLGRMRESLEKSLEEEDATLEMFHLG